jgi:hypothetical protein
MHKKSGFCTNDVGIGMELKLGHKHTGIRLTLEEWNYALLDSFAKWTYTVRTIKKPALQ